MIGTESEEERTKRTRRKLCKCQGDGGAVHGELLLLDEFI
jgi:hypothetical protein